MHPYQVPEAKAMSFKAVNDAANRILMRHGQQTLQGKGSFDVLGYVEFQLVKEHETDYHVSDDLPNGTWAETRFKKVILSSGTYLDASEGNGFARFTVCHEVGHAVLHQDLLIKRFRSSQLGSDGCELYTRDQLKPYRDPEWQANQFAAALLMPISGMTSLRQRYPEKTQYVSKVMEIFKVSCSAANYRMQSLIKKGKIAF